MPGIFFIMKRSYSRFMYSSTVSLVFVSLLPTAFSTTSSPLPLSITASSTTLGPALLIFDALLSTTTSIPTSNPPNSKTAPGVVSGDSNWVLRGCFNEPSNSTIGRALGASGEFLAPSIPSAATTLTVPICLDTCNSTVPSDNFDLGFYGYAGVENRDECYCGHAISNASSRVPDIYCGSPCAGDSATICGGYGYLTLYQLRSIISATNDTNTSTSSTLNPHATSSALASSSPSMTSASGSEKSRKNLSTGAWVGTAIAVTISITLILSLLGYFYRKRLERKKKRLGESMNGRDGISTNGVHSSMPQSRVGEFGDGRDGHVGGGTPNTGLTWFSTIAKSPAPAYVSPTHNSSSGQSWALGEDGKRDTYEAWKKGEVPPFGPGEIGRSVEIDDGMRSGGTGAGIGSNGNRSRRGSRFLGLNEMMFGGSEKYPAELDGGEKRHEMHGSIDVPKRAVLQSSAAASKVERSPSTTINHVDESVVSRSNLRPGNGTETWGGVVSPVSGSITTLKDQNIIVSNSTAHNNKSDWLQPDSSFLLTLPSQADDTLHIHTPLRVENSKPLSSAPFLGLYGHAGTDNFDLPISGMGLAKNKMEEGQNRRSI